MTEPQNRLHEAGKIWDAEASTFDNEPDHGLRDPATRAAWRSLLGGALEGVHGAHILDIGCGTGSLSVLLAGMGHHLTGIDASPSMLARAGAKVTEAGLGDIPFFVMDAADPQLPPRSFDVLVCRHLLWALPEPGDVLRRWADLLRPGGRMLLIEGFWHTGAGLHSGDIIRALPASMAPVTTTNLSDQPVLWGGPVADERYLIVAFSSKSA